ncbi:MAG: hypothetical protein HKO59_13930, partial [Phycisphaerales bacterium]|nr:hypothetical protein [Phycisphaerales bacterium]
MRFIRPLLAMGMLATATAIVSAAPPAVPATPAAIDQLVYAQPFTLDEAFRFEWQQEKPMTRSGYLLVMKVNPDLVYPRQSPEPVLYVGKQTAQRINVGYRSGHVVAIVPAPQDEAGVVTLDLAKTPIFFGTPELPERIDRTDMEAEHTAAVAAGVTALPADHLTLATRAAQGQPTAFRGDVELLRHAAQLIRR